MSEIHVIVPGENSRRKREVLTAVLCFAAAALCVGLVFWLGSSRLGTLSAGMACGLCLVAGMRTLRRRARREAAMNALSQQQD